MHTRRAFELRARNLFHSASAAVPRPAARVYLPELDKEVFASLPNWITSITP